VSGGGSDEVLDTAENADCVVALIGVEEVPDDE
jgi:hypothetical protein